MTTKIFTAAGKVQGVMFRQTLIRGLLKKNLSGGAANMPERDKVKFFISGEDKIIIEFIKVLKSAKELNNWGARVETLEEIEGEVLPEEYEVTTENVNDFDWSPNVSMYL